MSNQLKRGQASIDAEVKAILESEIIGTYDTVKTIRNWLKSDIQSSQEMVTMLENFLDRDEKNLSTDGTIDAKKFYEHIETLRYTVSLMEQAIIEN